MIGKRYTQTHLEQVRSACTNTLGASLFQDYCLIRIHLYLIQGMWLRPWISRLFNISRIPLPGCDMLSEPPSSSTSDTRSVTVLCKDFVYQVEVQDRDERCLPVGELEKRLWEVVEDVRARDAKGEKAVPIGILSADDRDIWAEVSAISDYSAKMAIVCSKASCFRTGNIC